MHLHITKVYRTDKDKAGNKLKTKDGREYTRISIKVQEHGDKWLSGFGATWNDSWQVGQEVEAEVKKNGEYLNFERVNPMTELNLTLMRHEQEIGRLWEAIKALQKPIKKITEDGVEFPIVEDENLNFDDSGAPLKDELDPKEIDPKDLPW